MGKFHPLLRTFNFTTAPFQEGANALGRIAAVVPRLEPALVASSFIRQLPSDPGLMRQAFLSLMQSPAVTVPLNGLSPSDSRAVKSGLAASGGGRIFEGAEALRILTGSLFDWEPIVAHAILVSVTQAGGLLDLGLGFERDYGVLGDFEAAQAALRGVEERFDRFCEAYPFEDDMDGAGEYAQVHEPLTTPRAGADMDRRAASGSDGRATLLRLFRLVRVGEFLQEEFPVSLYPEGRFPRHLGDLLLKVPGKNPGKGHCAPLHLVAGHLARRDQVRVQALPLERHLTIFDAATGWGFNFAADSLFVSLLEDWDETGFMAPGGAPLSREGLIYGILLNLASATEDLSVGRKLIGGLLAFFPNQAVIISALIRFVEDEEGREQLLRQAIRLSPRSLQAHARLGILYAHQGRYPEAREVLETAFREMESYRTARSRVFGGDVFDFGADDELMRDAREALTAAEILLNPSEDEKIAQLLAQIRRAPENLYLQMAAIRLVMLVAGQGQPEKAVHLCRELLEIVKEKKSRGMISLFLVISLAALNQWEEALACLGALIRDDPDIIPLLLADRCVVYEGPVSELTAERLLELLMHREGA